MISQNTIEKIRDAAEIAQVIGKFISIKQAGSSFTALCPFHNEKSPSFHITPSKGIYKCFGCGASGDSIKFLMEHERKTFVEALEWLASEYKITIERSEEKRTQAEVDEYDQMLKINLAATKNWCNELAKLPEDHYAKSELISNRKLTQDIILQFQLGFAPDDWKFLTPRIIEANLFEPAKKLGIIKTGDGKNWDSFRNRIMFPIHDHRGVIVGFSGRALHFKEETKRENPKYKNSNDSILYNKSRLLFGLFFATKAFKEKKSAYLVEGNYDVVSLHQRGVENTVAPCGTAIGEQQARLLKRYTDHVIIATDGDSAGIHAAMKAIDIFLSENFKVEVCLFPFGEDADSHARKFDELIALEEDLKQRTKNAIYWKAETLMKDSAADMDKRDRAINDICIMLSKIESSFKREDAMKFIAKTYNIAMKNLSAVVKDLIEEKIAATLTLDDDAPRPLPAHVDETEYLIHGFYEEQEAGLCGYYFPSGPKSHTQQSNFVVKPLFHVYSKNDNKRLIEITNGITKKILEMPSRSMISLDQFCGVCYEEGHFLFFGAKIHLLKILNKISPKFPLCYELKTLGWQPEGFFAFSNVIFNGELKVLDEYGIVEHDDVKYFSPSASVIYRDLRKDDDDYENDRFLSYPLKNDTMENKNIHFEEWCKLLCNVYPEYGPFGIGFVFMALFRDVIFKVDNNCPLMLCYGEKGSGKSKFAESLQNFFLNDLQPFNLNHGTDFAFFNRLSRFRNCITWFDEFDDNAIKEDRFQSIKGAYDGAGRERGKGTNKNKTEIARINSALVLTGQYLSTRDDNSALTRCIVLAFTPDNDRSKTAIDNYTNLKNVEKAGLSGMITELLKHREAFAKEYAKIFAVQFAELRNSIQASKLPMNERVLRNYTALMSCIKFFSFSRFTFPFTVEEFFERCKTAVVRLSKLISQSDALAGFWNMIVYLLETMQIETGFHFKFKTTDYITHKKGAEEITKSLGGMKKVLYLRLTTVHQLYSEAHKRSTGKQGIDLSTLRLYLESNPAFLCTIDNMDFRRKIREGSEEKIQVTKTSCYAFDYERLNINLEMNANENEEGEKRGADGEQAD